MKLKSKKSITTYEDRATAQNKKAQSVEINTINEKLGEFKTICGDMAKDAIRAANSSREIGLHLMTICGHERVSFEFWERHCNGKIKCTFEQAKRHVATAHKMPKPARTIEDAAPFIQTMFFASNLLEAPVREESQRALNNNRVQLFLKNITICRQPFEKALREKPMEQWKPSERDSLIADTEWLAVAREKALKLGA